METEKVMKTITTDVYTLHLMDNGIVYSTVSAEKEESIEGLEKLVFALGELINYKKAPYFCAHELESSPNKAVREMWAKEETCPYTIAEAFMTKSLGHKMVGNFYLNVNKPKRPTKLFTNKDKAIEWLKTFL